MIYDLRFVALTEKFEPNDFSVFCQHYDHSRWCWFELGFPVTSPEGMKVLVAAYKQHLKETGRHSS